MQNAYFAEDGNYGVLCQRIEDDNEQPKELILETTGVLWTHHLYPFTNRQECVKPLTRTHVF